MCTLSWRRDREGYTLLFNRDERNTRLPGLPPRVAGDEVKWIAPVDGDQGGTWILVNECGITMGLMNGVFQERTGKGEPRSRGLLVRDLAESESITGIESAISTIDPFTYRPFRFFALASGDPFFFVEWNGKGMRAWRDPQARPPIISSSIDETEVGRRRRAEYERLMNGNEDPGVTLLESYHRSHFPSPSAYSVCMHREDARTQSLTRVDVTGEEARMLYHAGPPCENAPEFEARIARAGVRP
jgi:hypothetical protein